MSETNGENFAEQVNAKLDEVDPTGVMPRFSADEGRLAWEAKERPKDMEPDAVVAMYAKNFIAWYRALPDNGSD